jgi:hypothetical protein
MSNCTAGCPTQDHASYGECLRSKAPVTANSTQSRDGLYSRHVENEQIITEYKAAKAQGIRPRGSSLTEIRHAVDASRKADAALTIR